MRTTKIFVSVAIALGMAAYACAEDGASKVAAPQATAQDSRYKAMGVAEIVDIAKKATTLESKVQIAKSLSSKIPSGKTEVGGLLDLVDSLKDESGNDYLKGAAKKAIRNLKDSSYAPYFATRMKEGGYESRQIAIQKVAEFKYVKAVPDLIDMSKGLSATSAQQLKSQEAYLKLNAFSALGDIGDESAIPAVMEKLGKLNGRDAQVISKFGNKVLSKLLDVTKTSKDPGEKEAAYSAISAMRDKAAIPLLWETAKSQGDGYLKNVAIGSLLKTTDETTTPKQKEVFDYLYSEADTRKSLRPQTMGIAKENKDITYLLKILNDKSPDNRGNRGYAIVCLGEIKAQSAVSALEETLKDSDRETRMRAAHALKQITGKDYAGN